MHSADPSTEGFEGGFSADVTVDVGDWGSEDFDAVDEGLNNEGEYGEGEDDEGWVGERMGQGVRNAGGSKAEDGRGGR